MSKITIIEARLCSPTNVEVFCTGARGAKQEWVVDYDRHNQITGAYCHKGPTCTTTKSQYYPATGPKAAADQIPQEVKDAAWKAFSETVKA